MGHVNLHEMKNIWRALVETGFVIFLFYANLLMGELERSGPGRVYGSAWASDIFTVPNCAVAVVAPLIGCLVVEFPRERLQQAGRSVT
jgi:hypothetical protein